MTGKDVSQKKRVLRAVFLKFYLKDCNSVHFDYYFRMVKDISIEGSGSYQLLVMRSVRSM